LIYPVDLKPAKSVGCGPTSCYYHFNFFQQCKFASIHSVPLQLRQTGIPCVSNNVAKLPAVGFSEKLKGALLTCTV